MNERGEILIQYVHLNMQPAERQFTTSHIYNTMPNQNKMWVVFIRGIGALLTENEAPVPHKGDIWGRVSGNLNCVVIF